MPGRSTPHTISRTEVSIPTWTTPGPDGKLAITVGSLLPVAPSRSWLAFPADQRRTIHDISQEHRPTGRLYRQNHGACRFMLTTPLT